MRDTNDRRDDAGENAAPSATTTAAGITTAGTTYTPEYDEYYRALWEGTPGRTPGATYEIAQPAYQLGHIAAAQPSFAGRDFHSAEPELRSMWETDFAARNGSWETARHYVCDAYGHARADGLGLRRDRSVVGSGGSAVDPVELERALSGLPSRADTPEGDEPIYPTDLTATTAGLADVAEGGGLGERPEIPANRARSQDLDVR